MFSNVCGLLTVILVLIIPAVVTASDTPRSIILILSGESLVYKRVADAIQQRILNRCTSGLINCKALDFKQLNPDNNHLIDYNNSLLTITLGTKAANWINNQLLDVDKIYAMLPYRTNNDLPSEPDKRIAKIYIDQPYERYLNLIKTTIPRSGRIGLLIHEKNLNLIDTLTDSAEQRGFTLITSIVSNERSVGEALSYILDDIDVLLALPDSRIHNSSTISHILTSAYRNSIPVIGFSAAYVRAGAAAAVYTSPDDIAQQVSDTVTEFLTGGSILDHTQFASYFSISFNFEVARSLNLPPIPPSEIKEMIIRGGE